MKQRFSQISSAFGFDGSVVGARGALGLAMLTLAFAFAPTLRAQEAAPETQDMAPVAEVVAPQEAAHVQEIPESAQAAAVAEAPESAPEPTVVLESSTPPAAPAAPASDQLQWVDRGEVVVMGNDVLIRANERASKVVAIGGDVKVLGQVDGEVVAIGGDVEMKGRVRGEMVAVGGDVVVDGPVGKVVAVFGDVKLESNARVAGEVVSVLGGVDNPHQVPIGGQSVAVGGGIPLPKFSGIWAWGCDVIGNVRLLSPHFAWPWYVFGVCVLFNLLLAAVFGRGVNACARVLEESPGTTLVTTIVMLPLLPLFVLLLILTGVGVLLLPFLFVALLFAGAFGKTAVSAFIGRSALRPWGVGAAVERAWLTVLVGVLLLAVLYCVPVLGLLIWAFTAWLGFGMVAAAMLQNRRQEKARIEAQRQATRAVAAADVATPQPPVMAAAEPAPAHASVAAETSQTTKMDASCADGDVSTAGPASSGAAGASVPPMMPPPESGQNPRFPGQENLRREFRSPDRGWAGEGLPRADFFLRVGALLIDIVLVAVVGGMSMALALLPFPLLFGGYMFALWLWRGTTVGGIVFNLQIVRLDGRPIDSATALVRTLVAFLSVFALGLGFLWCLWDPEGQTWHDKVAGTVVVRVPKPTPLV